MELPELTRQLGTSLGIEIPAGLSGEEARSRLEAFVNQLILDDFPRLVQLLYRMDVSEAKLKKLLRDYPGEDAGRLIASLMIDREIEKMKSREAFKKKDENEGDW